MWSSSRRALADQVTRGCPVSQWAGCTTHVHDVTREVPVTDSMHAFPLSAVGGTLILVGDPKQLGPVVKSNKAGVASELSIPLLDRLLAAGYPSVMLDKQYRMHPAIAAFPSQ